MRKNVTLKWEGRSSRSLNSLEVVLLIKVLQCHFSIVSTILSIPCLFHRFLLITHSLFPLFYADYLSQLSEFLFRDTLMTIVDKNWENAIIMLKWCYLFWIFCWSEGKIQLPQLLDSAYCILHARLLHKCNYHHCGSHKIIGTEYFIN